MEIHYNPLINQSDLRNGYNYSVYLTHCKLRHNNARLLKYAGNKQYKFGNIIKSQLLVVFS
jgi:hypothetical protein